jgi:hypothetical protein
MQSVLTFSSFHSLDLRTARLPGLSAGEDFEPIRNLRNANIVPISEIASIIIIGALAQTRSRIYPAAKRLAREVPY